MAPGLQGCEQAVQQPQLAALLNQGISRREGRRVVKLAGDEVGVVAVASFLCGLSACLIGEKRMVRRKAHPPAGPERTALWPENDETGDSPPSDCMKDSWTCSRPSSRPP